MYWKVTKKEYDGIVAATANFGPESLHFMSKVLHRSGLGDATYAPPSLTDVPMALNMAASRAEFEAVAFGAVKNLLNKVDVSPKQVGAVITNSSLFNTTPSLSATIMNHFGMGASTINYHLRGMGCSGGEEPTAAGGARTRHLRELDGAAATGNVTDAWIKPPKAPSIIPGQFVAAFRSDFRNASSFLDKLFQPLRSEGVEHIAHFKGGFNGFAFRLPQGMLKLPNATASLLRFLRSLPQIRHIEPDQVFYANLIMSESKGGKWEVPMPLFRMRAAAWSTRYTDAALVQPNCTSANACNGVVVAVLDTGVDGTHPDLAGNIVGGESFIGGNALVDENGHGTHVAGTISANNNGMGTMGLTPGQKVYALQVFDQLGSGSTTSIVAALNWLARFGRSKGIRVANMSLGGPKSWAVCSALDAVVRQGITMVVAAGNKGESMYNTSPPDCANALAVTSMTDYDGKPGGASTPEDMVNGDDTFTDFSNYAQSYSSSRVVAAPGRLVLSTWSQRACGRYGIQCVPWGPYAYMSGTSMAAPLVSALTARCYAKGVCKSSSGSEMARIVANAAAYNAANRQYGFVGDPYRPVKGKWMGFLVWGNQW
ncbi:MAG: peptidase S8/S53 domain-containing protein [Monoraphidium minutum]|nr:MAG: peptidase S8/S53 domain-containing protein [Monoraphidium minutum]